MGLFSVLLGVADVLRDCPPQSLNRHYTSRERNDGKDDQRHDKTPKQAKYLNGREK